MEAKVFHYAKVPENKVEMQGAEKVNIRWLLGPDDHMPNFYLRMFKIEKGGHTPYHSHPYEHEVYVLEGKGILKVNEQEHPIEPGYVAYVPPDALHQFLNAGDSDFVFLCIIPRT